jgi:hypothetical protein
MGSCMGDELKPLRTLDIPVNQLSMPPGLLDEARRRDGAIRAQFDGRTLSAELKMAGAGRGGRAFGFRVAGLARPVDEMS